MKKALIFGISGQDGAYLAKFLLNKDYKVFGASRDSYINQFNNLKRLKIEKLITKLSVDPKDFKSVYVSILKVEPDEIYFLSGQSSVGLSFEQPVETIESFMIGTLNVLESCRIIERPIKQYYAGSSECFGNTAIKANENSVFKPRSPYGVGKASSYWLTANYREAYKLFSCTGILFNHESILRPNRYVTQKIIQAVKRISNGSDEILELGRVDIKRDWGWAPEYIIAMWKMLQEETPNDYVIATGKSYTLKEFLIEAFNQVNLDWEKYVKLKSNLHRPTDIEVSEADPTLAEEKLGWKASTDMIGVVHKMINDHLF